MMKLYTVLKDAPRTHCSLDKVMKIKTKFPRSKGRSLNHSGLRGKRAGGGGGNPANKNPVLSLKESASGGAVRDAGSVCCSPVLKKLVLDDDLGASGTVHVVPC